MEYSDRAAQSLIRVARPPQGRHPDTTGEHHASHRYGIARVDGVAAGARRGRLGPADQTGGAAARRQREPAGGHRRAPATSARRSSPIGSSSGCATTSRGRHGQRRHPGPSAHRQSRQQRRHRGLPVLQRSATRRRRDARECPPSPGEVDGEIVAADVLRGHRRRRSDGDDPRGGRPRRPRPADQAGLGLRQRAQRRPWGGRDPRAS